MGAEISHSSFRLLPYEPDILPGTNPTDCILIVQIQFAQLPGQVARTANWKTDYERAPPEKLSVRSNSARITPEILLCIQNGINVIFFTP